MSLMILLLHIYEWKLMIALYIKFSLNVHIIKYAIWTFLCVYIGLDVWCPMMTCWLVKEVRVLVKQGAQLRGI